MTTMWMVITHMSHPEHLMYTWKTKWVSTNIKSNNPRSAFLESDFQITHISFLLKLLKMSLSWNKNYCVDWTKSRDQLNNTHEAEINISITKMFSE